MSTTDFELLDLVARWIHVIAGIMWIGNSLLFNWLDRSLDSPRIGGQSHEPIGTIWLLHSGGFYYVEKTLLGGTPLPTPLHWFKWQAYTTWLSGAALLVIVYYAGGRALVADPAVAPLTHRGAVLVGTAAITGGWLFYEGAQRFVAPRAPRIAAAGWIAGLGAISIALTQLMSGRAAFLHVGAMLGTIMAGNVLLTIVPSQRQLVATVELGRGGDPAVSNRAKRVSIHNNYFTFPVILLMLISHFPAVYAHRHNWLLLVILIVGGAAVRHVLNLRWTYAGWKAALAGVMIGTVAVLYWILRFAAPAGGESVTPVPGSRDVSFAEVRHVIERRCAVCHSSRPADATFGAAPGGVSFDSPEHIVPQAGRILERAVVTRTMPPANRTNMTESERALLGRWVREGALAR